MPGDVHEVWKEQLEKIGYTIDKRNVYQRTTDSAAGDTEYQNSVTRQFQTTHYYTSPITTKLKQGAVLLKDVPLDHPLDLDYTFFMGYTIIIDTNGGSKK